MPGSFYSKYGKRLLDITASSIGLLILFPFLLIISALIKISSTGKIFFIQERIGKNFIPFGLIKFRTMIPDAPRKGLAITTGDDPRITKIGKMLRKYKLDELPQLINVVKGDMSLVGPRPEVEKYVNYYRNEYKYILNVRPGITDLASIKYRDENSRMMGIKDVESFYINTILKDKIGLNLNYISMIGFILDIKIIFSTIFHFDIKVT